MSAADPAAAAAGILAEAVPARFGPPWAGDPDRGWIAEELGPRLFVAGGAVRAALEAAAGAPGPWAPKDLDVFALGPREAERFLARCEASGGSVSCDGELVWRLRSRGCREPIDLVLYDLGPAADAAAALATFDFDVNSVGWAGGDLIFPRGLRGQIIEGVGSRAARAQTGHVFLRRPVRAARRIAALADAGYRFSDEELGRYLANFNSGAGN